MALRDALDLQASVFFAGAVSLPALLAYYRRASVFCSLSEHEGFGVPLLEAMHLGESTLTVGERRGGTCPHYRHSQVVEGIARL